VRNSDHGQATGKLYHLRLRVECTLLLFTKPGANPCRIGVIIFSLDGVDKIFKCIVGPGWLNELGSWNTYM
jgi:hypothetical protein